MGLDQYAYCRAKEDGDYTDSRDIASWRKHANLQGWMERLWEKRNPDLRIRSDSNIFNGIELELSWEDLDELERAVTHGQLPATKGFFFGDGADDYYKETDLDFVRKARAELFLGLKVFYNSSW